MDFLKESPELLTLVATACAGAGGRALLVGGCVRDGLLGRKVKDWDVEVYGLPRPLLERTLRRVGRVNAVGKAFGVFKLSAGDVELDISLPRRDSNAGPGHKGIAVEGDPHMSVREAARRRDLTINALLVDLETGALLDPWGGLSDLEARVLRAVDAHTFLEDPLRALRAVQFSARLGFEAAPSLVQLCAEAALDELPAERIAGEWQKLLLKGEQISRGLALARRAGILARVFPELPDRPEADAELDALVPWREQVQGPGRRWALMLTAWLRHAPDAVEATLDRLWLHKVEGYPLRTRVMDATRHIDHAIATDADLRWLSTRAEVETVLLVRGEHAALGRARALGVAHDPPAPVLKGRHLKRRMPPGPGMGQALNRAYAAQLDGRVRSLEEALELLERDVDVES